MISFSCVAVIYRPVYCNAALCVLFYCGLIADIGKKEYLWGVK